jgi:CheY-specific phosphatase CheX
MSNEIKLSDLLGAARHAVDDVLTRTLSMPTALGEPSAHASAGLQGSLITLSGGATRVCVGISSSPYGCRALAGAMLGMDASEAAELSHDELRDSIAELVNIVAGAIKTQLVERDPQLVIGLPVYVEGAFEGATQSQSVFLPCHVGEIGCMVTLIASFEAA